jgi:ubiquinone/menaquinone biosynthesis C-methylase UbiE
MSDSNVRQQIDHYSKYAEKFENTIWTMGPRENRNHRIKIAKIVDALRSEDGGRVLEIGVGSGLHAEHVLEHTKFDYTGFDASTSMLKMAAQRLERHADRFHVGIGDAHKLPVADGAFDAVFCSGTMHHLRDPARGMHEIARAVKPGGPVAVMEPNWKFPSMLVAGLVVRAEREVFRLSGPKMLQWARAAGLEDIKLERVLYTPPKPERWAAKFDRFDKWAAGVAGLRRWSVMLFLTARRPA